MAIQKVLIIGGAGFVGANLSLYLNNQGYTVTVFDNLVRRGVENNLPIFKKNNIQFVHGDIRNKEDLNNLKNIHDIVLLCAAQPSAVNYANPEFDITNNTVGVLNVLEYIRDSQTPIIFWSTNKVYSGTVCNTPDLDVCESRFNWLGTPCGFSGWDKNLGFNECLSLAGNDRSIYGLSKLMSDAMIQEWSDAYGIPAIINRFSCISGPMQWGLAEQGWVTWFAIANLLELPISIFGYDGYQVRDILYIDDLCILIEKQMQYLEHDFTTEVYNVGGGHENTLSILEAISFLSLEQKPFVSVDIHEARRADQAIYISDISRVSKKFNWSPTISPLEGYRKIIKWTHENKELLESMYYERRNS